MINLIEILFEKFIFVLIKLFDKFISIFSKDHVRKTMSLICPAVESENSFAAYLVRPKDSIQIPILKALNNPQKFAIIMQGPICEKESMTYKTVLFYQRVYPGVVIIVSTWEDEPENEIKKLQNLGAVVITSKKPLYNGIINVNLQLCSSLAGAKMAKKLGCEFSVKTRTDQRVCKPFIFDSMLSAVNLFPAGKNQKGRIVTLGIKGGGMLEPYFMSDFLYFGNTEDLIQLFSAPMDYRKEAKNQRDIIYSMTRKENAEKMLCPEIYIFKHYCNDKLGYYCEDTIEKYWEIVRDNFICFGMKDIDLLWMKYDKQYDLNFNFGSYYGLADSENRCSTMNFDFFNWLNLYTGRTTYNKEYEKYLDVKLVPSKSEIEKEL